jgi:hypothetical protein
MACQASSIQTRADILYRATGKHHMAAATYTSSTLTIPHTAAAVQQEDEGQACLALNLPFIVHLTAVDAVAAAEAGACLAAAAAALTGGALTPI